MADVPRDPVASVEVAPAVWRVKTPSRRVATIWSLFFSYGAMVLVLIRNLALVPLYLKHLGMEEYGAWLATGGVLGYLTVTEFGQMAMLTQQAAVAYGAGDISRLGKTIGIGLRISIVLALFAGVLAALLAPFVPGFLGLTGPVAHRLTICFLIVALTNSLNLISLATGGVLKAFQRTFAPGILNVFSDALSIVTTIVLILRGWGLYAIAIGLAVRGLVAVGGNSVVCFWVCYRTLHLRLSCHWRDTIDFWRMSVYQFAMRMGAVAGTQQDAFLIGVILGPKTAGGYVLTIRAHDMVRVLAARFADAIMPPLAHLHGEGRPSRFRDITIMAIRFQALLSIIGMVGVVTFDRSFMKLWIGPGVYVGGWTNLLIAIWGTSFVAIGALWQALYAMGLLSSMAKIVWLEVFVKFPLLIALLYAFGIIGAPIAVVVAHIVAVVALFVVAIREMRLGAQELWRLLDTALRIFAACALSAFFVNFAFSTPLSWRWFAIQACAYGALAILLTAAFNRGESAHLFRAVAQRVFNRFQRAPGKVLSSVGQK